METATVTSGALALDMSRSETAVIQVLNRYCIYFDRAQVTDLVELWTEDCHRRPRCDTLLGRKGDRRRSVHTLNDEQRRRLDGASRMPRDELCGGLQTLGAGDGIARSRGLGHLRRPIGLQPSRRRMASETA